MQCVSPYYRKESGESFPCGKCPVCIDRRIRGWTFRLKKQAEVSTSAFFITVTYDTDSVPITPSGFMSLKKRDIQLLFKRLRKKHKQKLSYYLCGEYGPRGNRPHYHAIIFNLDLVEFLGHTMATIAKGNPDYYLDGYFKHYSNYWSEKLKSKGYLTIGQVTPGSIYYTVAYMFKPQTRVLHTRDDRQKQFSLMSKGLGSNYLTPQMIKWHGKKSVYKDRMYCPLEDGFRSPMPRYYKEKLYSKHHRELIALHIQEQQENKTSDEHEKDRLKLEALVRRSSKEKRKLSL